MAFALAAYLWAWQTPAMPAHNGITLGNTPLRDTYQLRWWQCLCSTETHFTSAANSSRAWVEKRGLEETLGIKQGSWEQGKQEEDAPGSDKS